MATTVQIGTSLEEAPVISANGQFVVFRKYAEIYIRDLFAGENSLISVSSEEEAGNVTVSGFDDSIAISADGRFVAFESKSTNLVPNDTNGESDLFLRDTVEGTTSLISIDPDGNGIPANFRNTYFRPSISADGRFVAFQTSPDSGVGFGEIFVRDVESNTTELISVNSDGVRADETSSSPSISADGRFVAFKSLAVNLVAEDRLSTDFDIFVRDRQNQTTIRASVNSQGEIGSGVSENEDLARESEAKNPVMSPDGSYVVFSSSYTNLVPNDTNGFSDIFKHDLETGETTRISVDSNGNQANGGSLLGFSKSAISADGRYIVFQSGANNLVEGDTNNATDVFVRDIIEETTTRVSVNSNGEEPVGGSSIFKGTISFGGTISGDGSFIVFESNGNNMNDEGIDTDRIYLRDTTDSTEEAPTVANPIADITVEEGAENQTIDLGNVFSDADGDEITIAVQANSNPELVSVTIEDNNLTLDFLENQLGSAEITLRATANGQTVDDTFSVTVDTDDTDEPNPEPEPNENLLNTDIFRFQNNDVPGTYIYVTQPEAENIRDNFDNFTEEGKAFQVAVESGDDLMPMYRFQSEDNPGTYLFVGETERENIQENFAESFSEEGLAFYTRSADSGLGTSFSRFHNNAQPGTYLFATGSERENIRENFPNFEEEGIAFSVEV